MEKKKALTSLAALAHAGRLDIFRLLVAAGAEGLVAGEIATALDMKANTLSSNLGILANSELIAAEREGRNIRYRAGMAAMQALIGFLMEDCCSGNPDFCAPIVGKTACG